MTIKSTVSLRNKTIMRIAVIGPGAIGALVAGYLKEKKKDVILVGNSIAAKEITNKGVVISGVRGDHKLKIDCRESLDSSVDLIILAVKTQDVRDVFKAGNSFSKNAIVLTTQNGVQADNITAKFIDKQRIISSIVMFGATCLEPGMVVHNFEGNWLMGRPFVKNDQVLNSVVEVLNEIFPATAVEDILGMKYLKVFVNANNCIPAILGFSMQECFADLDISRIAINIWKEGFEVVNKAGLKLVSLPDFPLERLVKLTSMPVLEAAKIFSGIMTNLSKEPLYGSVLQSIKRNKPSEIDYLNGEFVNIARNNSLSASLNEKLVEMVHQVERNNKFFSKVELLKATQILN